MANFYDEQISHMKHLMDYGMKNESKKSQYSSVMNMKEGADGRVYGIVAEGTKYYVKSCPKGKENLTESFDYIGGFLNRKDCAYSSYADAVKDMDMRLMSLNEDHGKRMPINEMKRSADFMDSGMIEMQEDIARHRQILENIDVIYQNKKSGIGDRNIGVPEAPKTQDFHTKVGDPFEDTAKYEANRDNEENAKDHEKQGGPFKEDGTVDSEDMQKADKLPTQDSNTPGDTYTKKAQYVPKDAVAAMNPSGGKVVRVNEAYGDHHDPEWTEDVPEGPYDSQFDLDVDKSLDNMGEGLDAEENHFPEENPDLAAAEVGELGDPADDLSPEDLEGGMPVDDDLEGDEFLSQFNDDPDDELDAMSKPTEDGEMPNIEDLRPSDGVSDPDLRDFDPNASHLAGDSEEIAGIDDMSGVDRNNLSAEVIDDVVSEIVNKFSKGKKMNMISESVANSILSEMFDEKEGEKKEREYYHDDDFMYGVPERQTADSDFKSPSPLSQYMDKGSRVANKTSKGTLDPRKGAPSYVNPAQVDYDPESEYYLQNKYELGLNDDPEADYTESGAWKATDEKARKYATARVAKAQQELEMLGSDMRIDTEKAVDTFRHALYTLQNAKNNLAIMIGVHPEMIEKFLTGNNIPFRNVMGNDDQGNLFGYKDAKDTPKCIITPDGELPLNTDMNGDDEEEENVNYVVGPSLLAMGFPEMSTPELKELVDDLFNWDDNYGAMLEEEENTMRDFIKYIQGLGYSENAKYAKTLNNVVTEWVSLLEDIAGLQSFAALPMEVLNKREEAANMSKRKANGIRGGYEEFDGSVLKNLHEETTVLHDFGNHPGYRKKPVTTPANTEVAPNGARDWNDESAKGEEPFGKKIGSSAPFTDLVDTITKEVLKHLKGGQN